MGTRADFYIGKGKNAEWLGSIALDGYPSGIPKKLLKAKSEQEFRERLAEFFLEREDVTLPADGWPWPWNTSDTSDYGYAFFSGSVWYSIGYPESLWWRAADGNPPNEESDNYEERMAHLEPCDFPDMSARKNVRFDKGSGLIIIGG